MPEPTIHDSQREPVISTDLADALADLLTEYGVASPFSVDYSLPKGPDGKYARAYWRIPYDFENLPDFWALDVATVLAARKTMEAEKRYHEAVDDLAGPYVTSTVRAYLHEQHGTDGWADPNPHSLAFLRKTFLKIMREAARGNKSGRLPKLPVLRLYHAIFFNRLPDALAGYASYIVPMDLSPMTGAPLNDVLQALHRFVDALRTTNGMSGVGKSWTVHIHPSSEFAILTSRSSLPE